MSNFSEAFDMRFSILQPPPNDNRPFCVSCSREEKQTFYPNPMSSSKNNSEYNNRASSSNSIIKPHCAQELKVNNMLLTHAFESIKPSDTKFESMASRRGRKATYGWTCNICGGPYAFHMSRQQRQPHEFERGEYRELLQEEQLSFSINRTNTHAKSIESVQYE